MRGDTVIVRAYRGEPLMRRVWDADTRLVYLCSERQFQGLWRGELRVLPPLGFPREDVFVYDAALLAELEERWQTDPTVWDRATAWQTEKRGA